MTERTRRFAPLAVYRLEIEARWSLLPATTLADLACRSWLHPRQHRHHVDGGGGTWTAVVFAA